MAQVTDKVIANGSGSAVRSDINNVLAAIDSNNSGTSAPSNTVAGMFWLDTGVSPAALKVRNASNTAWVEVSSDTVPANSVRGNPTGSTTAETNVNMSQLKTMLGWEDSKAVNGYVKLPTGLIIQYGSGSFGPFTTSASVGISFPITFPVTVRSLSASVDTPNNSVTLTVSGASSTGFTANFREFADVSTTGTIRWMAIGGV